MFLVQTGHKTGHKSTGLRSVDADFIRFARFAFRSPRLLVLRAELISFFDKTCLAPPLSSFFDFSFFIYRH